MTIILRINMNKNELIAILEEWNFWKKQPDTGIERSAYLNKLEKFVMTNQITAIIGARRSGKSFVMKQFVKRMINAGLNKNNTLMVNFEDPRLEGLDVKLLQKIYEAYLEFLNPEEKPFIFLDEVQEVKGWEKWVMTIHELRKAKIVITGSNASLLSRELATLLSGRHLDIVVFPLSFEEFLTFNNIVIKDRLDIVAKRIEIKRLLRAYIEFGSFPEVALSSEKREILLKYFEDIITKDLIRRFKIRKMEKLSALARFYLTNIASPITFTSIEKFLGISSDTIEKFSSYLEMSYLLFFLKRFSFKIKEQEKSPRKVYTIDPGLANAVGFKCTENIGKMAENIVFINLKRKQSANPNIELYYWKDSHHREVDFVIKNNRRLEQLIQVCWDITNPKTKNREITALLKASKELSCNNMVIITEDDEAEEAIKGKKIQFIPLWKWLLAGQ